MLGSSGVGGVGEGLGGGGQLCRSFSKDDVEMLLGSVAAEVVQFDCFLNGLRCVFSPANEKGLKQQSWLLWTRCK